jgi:hypothetical protein
VNDSMAFVASSSLGVGVYAGRSPVNSPIVDVRGSLVTVHLQRNSGRVSCQECARRGAGVGDERDAQVLRGE